MSSGRVRLEDMTKSTSGCRLGVAHRGMRVAPFGLRKSLEALDFRVRDDLSGPPSARRNAALVVGAIPGWVGDPSRYPHELSVWVKPSQEGQSNA
jgi:hypothetical protein